MRDILLPVAERIARATYQLGRHTHGWDDTSPMLQGMYLEAVTDAMADTKVTALSVADVGRVRSFPVIMEGNVELANLGDADLPHLRRALGDLNALALLGRESLETKPATVEPDEHLLAKDFPTVVADMQSEVWRAWSAKIWEDFQPPVDSTPLTLALPGGRGYLFLPADTLLKDVEAIYSTFEALAFEDFVVTPSNAHELLGRSCNGKTIGWLEIGAKFLYVYDDSDEGDRVGSFDYGDTIRLDRQSPGGHTGTPGSSEVSPG